MFKRNSAPGGGRGGKKFGGSGRDFKPHGFGGRDGGFQKPQFFKATCAGCGDSCEVPFRPNGSKPVYCRDCFKKEDSSGDDRFGGFRKPNFAARRAPEAAARDDRQLEKKLDEMQVKLDRILREIEAMKEQNG